MDYIDGHDLATLLQRQGGGFPVDTVMAWADQLLTVLVYLHTRNPPVIHRDIKPQNLKLAAENTIMLLDFGLAKGHKQHALAPTSESVHGFTERYAPLEQIHGSGTDARSDLFALAATLYHLLSGYPPPAILERVAEERQGGDPLRPLHETHALVPEYMSQILTQALAINADDRPESARQMQAMLHGHIPPVQKAVPIPWSHQAAAPTGAAHPARRTGAPADPQRSRMITHVHTTWIKGVLNQSLDKAVWIELGLTQQPGAVEHPWKLVLQRPAQQALPLSPETAGVDVFDAMLGSLLILGAPGAGKTTMLLELTDELLKRSEHDPTYPIPVVFHLSSWANQRLPLHRWMSKELNQRYQVTKDLASTWVEQNQILPLLDGLDEVAAPHRAACVAAINQFRQTHTPPGLVVCSRIADYEALESRLQLQGAVCIQPLTEQQVDAYFAQAGAELAAVRTVLQEDAVLREMTSTPLMMSIMSLAYAGLPVEEIRSSGTVEERRGHLFDTYIERMFQRRGANHPFSKQQTTQWLSWLAQGMQRHAQSVFYLENIQPDWLPQKWLQWLFHSAVGISLGVIFWIFFNSSSSPTSSLDSLQALGIALGIILGANLLIEGVAAGLTAIRNRSVPPLKVETWRARIGSLLHQMLNMLAIIPAAFISVQFIQQFSRATLSDMPYYIGIGLLITPLIYPWMVQWFSDISRGDAIRVVETIHWSWSKAGHWLARGLLIGYGLAVIVITVSLGFMVTPIGSIDVGIGIWLPRLLIMLVLGSVVGGSLGLFLGAKGSGIHTRTHPNQGMHRTARIALLFGLVGGPLMSLFIFSLWQIVTWIARTDVNIARSMFPLVVSQRSSSWDDVETWAKLLLAGLLVLAPLIALLMGGYTCLQHSVLRLMLAATTAMPVRYVRFLDYAAERLFLRRAGGGYIFAHRLLLEHFARMPDAQGRTGEIAKPQTAVTPAHTADGETQGPHTTPTSAQTPVSQQANTPPVSATVAPSTTPESPHQSDISARDEHSPGHQRARFNGTHRQRMAHSLTIVSGIITLVLCIAIGSLLVILSSPHRSLVGVLQNPDLAPLIGITFSPDSQVVAAISAEEGTGYLWQTDDHTLLHALSGMEGKDYSFYGFATAFTADSALVAASAPDGMIHLWRVRDGTAVRTWGDAVGHVRHLAFAPNGNIIAAGRAEHVDVWDKESGTIQHTIEAENIQKMTFTPNSQTLILETADTVQHWRMQDGELLHALELPRTESANDSVGLRPWLDPTRRAITRDGQIVAAINDPGIIQLWHVRDSTLLHTLTAISHPISRLHFSPDGQVLATLLEDRTLQLWRVVDGTLLHTLEGDTSSIAEVTFSSDTRQVAAVLNDGSVQLWRQHDGVLLRHLDVPPEPATESDHRLEGQPSPSKPAIAFSPDGNTIVAVGTDDIVRIWDVQSKRLLSDVTLDGVTALTFAPDGQTVLASTLPETSYIIRVRDGTILHTVDGITDLSVSPDNAFVTAFDGALQRWSVSDGASLGYVAHGHTNVRAMAFSPDATKLATGGDVIRIWRVRDGTLVQTIPTSTIDSLAFSPDGDLLAASSAQEDTLTVWNTADGTQRASFSNAHAMPGPSYSTVAFSPNGATVAAGFQDGSVIIGRVADGELLHTLKAHHGAVLSTIFEQDGESLITCSLDRTVKVWDVSTGTVLETRHWHARPVIDLPICSPNGELVIANDGDGSIRMWQIEP